MKAQPIPASLQPTFQKVSIACTKYSCIEACSCLFLFHNPSGEAGCGQHPNKVSPLKPHALVSSTNGHRDRNTSPTVTENMHAGSIDFQGMLALKFVKQAGA